MKKLIVMILAVCCSCVYGDEFWDLMNSVRGTCGRVKQSMEIGDLQAAAIESENWNEAARLSLSLARLNQCDEACSAYLYVSYMVTYAMCLWNDSPYNGNRSLVCSALADAASYSDRRLGAGTGARIRVLCNRIRCGALDGQLFTQTDFTKGWGVLSDVCDLPFRASQRMHDAYMRQPL